MITKEHIQEHLSRVYVHAVTAKAGHIFELPHTDYGVDGTLFQVENRDGRLDRSGFSLDLQLKATMNWSIRGSDVIYDVESKTYNDLISRFSRPRATPMILIVLCLPKQEVDWLHVNSDKMTLKHCCYWCQLSGPPTKNRRSKRIKIPQSNLFTPATVVSLMKSIETGDLLP